MIDGDELQKLLDKSRKKRSKRKKKIKYSKIIVMIIILLNAVFASAVLYVLLTAQTPEPTTLIISWFAFTTGELWLLSGIKKKEIKEGGNDED